MLNTHTIQIQGQVHNTAKYPLNSRVVITGRYAACIVATATRETVKLANQELAANRAEIAKLTADLAKALLDLGFESEKAFEAARHKDSRMGVVPTIQELKTKISRHRQDGERMLKVQPQVGDQAVVGWKGSVEAAQADITLKKGRVYDFVRQGYDLEIRTDFEVTSKPERVKSIA